MEKTHYKWSIFNSYVSNYEAGYFMAPSTLVKVDFLWPNLMTLLTQDVMADTARNILCHGSTPSTMEIFCMYHTAKTIPKWLV